MTEAIYDTDFYTWTQQQADLLRQRRFGDADIEHLIEELETMGATERRTLIHRLGTLLTHLLKWRYQPVQRGRSWQLTIEEQQRKVLRVIEQNPGLKPSIGQILSDAYGDALIMASRETALDKSEVAVYWSVIWEVCGMLD